LGWLGDHVSIGLTDYSRYDLDGGQTAAHEFGHNLRREHAPCGNPAYPDPDYPYSNGIIGQFGFNLSQFTVIPNTYKDIMSYCSPEWVSDYTYIGFGNDQIAHGDSMPMGQSVQSVIVRASLDQDGKAKFEPFYEFKGQPTSAPESSEYSIEMLNDVGKIVATHPVKVYKAEEQGIFAHTISAVIPKPQESITTIRLVENGKAITTETITSVETASEIPDQTPIISSEQVGEKVMLNWGIPDIPAMVRTTSDDGMSWITLGIDVTDGYLRLYTESMLKGEIVFEITFSDNASPTTYYSWENN